MSVIEILAVCNTSLKDPAMGYNTAIVKSGLEYESKDSGGEVKKQRKMLVIEILPNLKKTVYKDTIHQLSRILVRDLT